MGLCHGEIMSAAKYSWYRRLPRGAMHGGASHLFAILPVFVLHDRCMHVRQDGKFSSNLLLLLISRTYQHILESGKSWGAFMYRIYTTLSLCSHFGSSLSSLDIYRSTSRLFLTGLVAAQH